MNPLHEANRKRWEAASDQWSRGVDLRGQWKPAYSDPRVVLLKEELELLGEVRNKDVCVLGSGDNQAVFALSGMGAKVTSVDITQKQLDHAQRRARELGAEITFVCSDVTDLAALRDRSFDIVYTGGHVAVWVSDLKKYYAEASRILRPGGKFIINEYHPFRRLWKDNTPKLEMAVGYFERARTRTIIIPMSSTRSRANTAAMSFTGRLAILSAPRWRRATNCSRCRRSAMSTRAGS